MIITLTGATFSTSIGTLDSWFIQTSITGGGLTASGSNIKSIRKDDTVGATLTYTYDTENYKYTNGTVTDATGATVGSISGSNGTVTVTLNAGNTIKGKITIAILMEYIGSGEGGGGDGTDPTPGSTMTLKAYFDSVNAPTTVYKFLDGTVSWVGGENYRHCIIPLSSGISHVKIATGTKDSGVAGLLYLSSGAITSSSIVTAVYGTDTSFITHSTFRGLNTDISAPEGATHIAIGEFINKATIGCTDDDLILTFGSGGGGSTDEEEPTIPENYTSLVMDAIGTTADTYKYDGSTLTMVGSSTSQTKYRHVIAPVASYNITHLCCITGNNSNDIGPVLFLSSDTLAAENVIDSKFGAITDTSIVRNSSFKLFDEDITIPSGCTHIAWIEYNPIDEIIDTSKCDYTVTYS